MKSRYYRKIKKDYQSKNLQNPFFHKKTKGKNPRLRRYLVLALLTGFVVIIWFFFASSFWRFQHVNIVGLTHAEPNGLANIIWNQAKDRRLLFFHQSNIFLFNKKKAVAQIITDYNFSGATVKEVFPRTIEVDVQERPYAFIYQEGNSLFYASADGCIIKEPAVSAEDQKKYLLLENKNGGSLIGDNNKINVANGYLSFLMNLNASLAAHAGELPVERYIIDQEFNTIKVKFVNGPLAYFNTKDDAGVQINNLLLVKKEKIKDNFSKTNYIDLRYGDRIFINPDFK